MKRTPGVLTLPSSRGVVTKIGILWIAECRDISLEVVLNIVNERRGDNDEGAHLQCRPLGRMRCLARYLAAPLPAEVLCPCLATDAP